MKKGLMIFIGVAVLLFVFTATVFFTGIGYFNKEVGLRKTIEMKQEDNKSEYDNMFKQISQVAQVTQAHKDGLKEIFSSYANARGGADGKIMSWLQEAVPNVDLSTYNRLQTVIVTARNRWTMRQKELLDLKREHDTLLEVFPSSVVMSMFGREPIDVQIVTSSKTDESFETGKDDDTSVFGE